MARKVVLLLLAFFGSAVCWWPAIIEPSLDFPRWIILGVIASISVVSILLRGERGWLGVVAITVSGSFAGMLSGVIRWPSSDGIANSYALFAVLIATAATAAVALTFGFLASVAVRRWPVSNDAAKLAWWIVLGLCLAFGPTILVLTKPLVERRVARNESIAAIRFACLKRALALTKADKSAENNVCDGQSLQQHYFGPPFTNEDWSRISGNYVQEDKYVYMISCRQQGKYLLEARPKMPRVYGYGTRIFCANELGDVPCALEWNR